MTTSDAAARIRAALDLYEVGEAMLRQRIRRENPGATEIDVEREIAAWLAHRPGAEFADYPGPASDRVL